MNGSWLFTASEFSYDVSESHQYANLESRITGNPSVGNWVLLTIKQHKTMFVKNFPFYWSDRTKAN